jgi:hypothetical protein
MRLEMQSTRALINQQIIIFSETGKLHALFRKHFSNVTLPRTITCNQMNTSITSKVQYLAN